MKSSLFLYLVLCAERGKTQVFTLRLQSTLNGNEPFFVLLLLIVYRKRNTKKNKKKKKKQRERERERKGKVRE